MRMVDFPQNGWSMLLHIPEIKWWWWQTLEKYQNCKDWGKFGKTFLKVKPFVTFIDKLLHFHFCRRHEWNNEEYTNHPYVGIRQCRESSRTIHFALLQRWAHCRRSCRGTPATVCMISFKTSAAHRFVMLWESLFTNYMLIAALWFIQIREGAQQKGIPILLSEIL